MATDLIHFLSEEIIEEHKIMSKFCDGDKDLFLNIVLDVIQANKCSEHYQRKLESTRSDQINPQIRNVKTAKLLNMIETFQNQLFIQDYHIYNEKYQILRVGTLGFLVFPFVSLNLKIFNWIYLFLKIWSRILNIRQYSDDHFKENLDKFIINEFCWGSLVKVL